MASHTAVRISFNNERAASINYWTERIIVRANNHPWLSVLNYAVAFFQKYQNAPPDAWFNTDLELIADHLITSSPQTTLGPPTKPLRRNQTTPFIQTYVKIGITRKGDVRRRKDLELNALVFMYVILVAKATTKLINALNSQLPVHQVDPLGPTLRSHHEQI